MKTTPMAHQRTAQDLLDQNRVAFALACEQGTGKSWMLLNDAERKFERGEISGLLVIAPKGVHTNWIKREAPAHLSIPWTGVAWKSGAPKSHMDKIKSLNTVGARLAILTLNVDAINTPKGYAAALAFLKAHKAMMVIDESQRIKNKEAKRTEKAIDLGVHAVSRRIASGTLVTQGPQDLFSQFQFLKRGCLGTSSYRAFVSEYADVLPPEHPLVTAARRGSGRIPMIIRRDHMGRPVYRNMDKLHGILTPLMYRVKKADCLDLPDKVYQTIEFELDPAHKREYDRIKSELRFEFGDDDLDTYTELTIINKLRQVSSGYILRDGERHDFANGQSRLRALEEIIEDNAGPMIIWASYIAEINSIVSMLSDRGLGVASYYGGTSARDREQAIDDFQAGNVQYFVSNPAAGGTGITLTAAQTVVYYSNSPSLEHRLQSEDRCHRIGLKHPVLYIDLVAEGTVDERLAASLQRKEFVARAIVDGAF